MTEIYRLTKSQKKSPDLEYRCTHPLHQNNQPNCGKVTYKCLRIGCQYLLPTESFTQQATDRNVHLIN